MIKRFLLRDLSLKAVVTYLDDVCTLVSQSPVGAPVQAEVAELRQLRAALLDAISPRSTKELTRQLRAHDKVRCRMAACLFKLVDAFRDVPDRSSKEAAATVGRLLKRWGTATKLANTDMNSRSALVGGILHRCRSEASIATAVDGLPGARITVDALEEAQHTFLLTQRQRLQQRADHRRPFTGSQKRTEAARALNDLLDIIQAQVLLTREEDWKNLARQVHQVNRRIAHNIAIRAGKRRARKEKALAQADAPTEAAPVPAP